MYHARRLLWILLAMWTGLTAGFPSAAGHDHTRRAAQRARAAALAKAQAFAWTATNRQAADTCELTIDLVDAETHEPLCGLVRLTDKASGKALQLSGEIHRAANWFSLESHTRLQLPRTKVQIEAVRGLRTELATVEVDLSSKPRAAATIRLQSFCRSAGVYSGNTHLHLMELTHAEADRYLRVVPRSDNLDLVFLSHLRRIPDERNYISNLIVENSFTGGALQRLSQHGTLLANGEEHRHDFGQGVQGYGHVMLLDLVKLIRPVSIGPRIMRSGTDWPPLQRGIRAARTDGATVIWCHNTYGLEAVPNWMAGLVHAQNIFDGGSQYGSYEHSFYRYLNLGMRVPFSTGTDWFVYDFSRVYTPVAGQLTAEKWLNSLRNGRSYITNGPLLEFEADGHTVGSTIALSGAREIKVIGAARGRRDFRGLELVHNGSVVFTSASSATEGHYRATLNHTLKITEPGWVALRIPRQNGQTELDRTLFAHTSPIYIEIAGRQIFRPEIARQMISEIEANIETIKVNGVFRDDQQRESVLSVYRAGIEALENQIARNRRE